MNKLDLISMAEKAKNAINNLLNEQTRRLTLNAIAENLIKYSNEILLANAIDIENAKQNGLSASLIDRLTLNKDRIEGIKNSVLEVANLPSPLKTEDKFVHKNGMIIKKTRVPMGVIAMIYEARPNVTVDASCLCLMSGNAVILRGGKEAINTNITLVKYIKLALSSVGVNENAVNLISDTSYETAETLMSLKGYIDLLIPRGSKRLIDKVTSTSKIPVIETGAGNCHTYVEKTADLSVATKVIINAKTSRPSVCNAMEKLLVDSEIAGTFLPMIKTALDAYNVEIRGCEKSTKILKGISLATEDDWFTEYNDFILSIKIVDNYVEAVNHINKYGTKHSECIITENEDIGRFFTENVDASAVYINASTRFTDGGEFGLGAEIGISTQKLHARGPFALDALTTTKYVIYGNGQTR